MVDMECVLSRMGWIRTRSIRLDQHVLANWKTDFLAVNGRSDGLITMPAAPATSSIPRRLCRFAILTVKVKSVNGDDEAKYPLPRWPGKASHRLEAATAAQRGSSLSSRTVNGLRSAAAW